ncbi:hypothetical protein [Marinoscillum pacificum]|uniref:hypothetical protein n=1 Tax=Marinoscillum pacificum TaxID=392723 RepID=UPI00215787F9|nr:hypothetical protein [Marinoscillum pacificum]
MPVKKIFHKGKEIIYVDYRGETEDQMLNTAENLRSMIMKDEKEHLRLVNITEAFATTKFTNYIRQLGKDTKHIPTKAAIVGITGAKKVLLLGYNRILGGAMRPFDDEDTAKEYLVK